MKKKLFVLPLLLGLLGVSAIPITASLSSIVALADNEEVKFEDTYYTNEVINIPAYYFLMPNIDYIDSQNKLINKEISIFQIIILMMVVKKSKPLNMLYIQMDAPIKKIHLLLPIWVIIQSHIALIKILKITASMSLKRNIM